MCPVMLCCMVCMHHVGSWEWVLSYNVDESCDITWMRHVDPFWHVTGSFCIMWSSHVTSRCAQFWQHSRLEKSWRFHMWIMWLVISCEWVMLCHVNEYVTCHFMWMSHVVSCGWVMLCHVNESCCVMWMSHVVSCEWVMLCHVNESCCVMWMSHVVSCGWVMLCHVDESCCVMWMSHVVSCEWVMLCHVDESCHITSPWIVAEPWRRERFEWYRMWIMWLVIWCEWVVSCHVDESCHITSLRSVAAPWRQEHVLYGILRESCDLSFDVNESCCAMWMSRWAMLWHVDASYVYHMSESCQITRRPISAALSRRKRSLALASHTNLSGPFYRSLFIYM